MKATAKAIFLTDEEWAEVYYALDKKANELEDGSYGETDDETNVEEWAGQLRGIMAKIIAKVDV